jgi:predicted peptidase
MIPGQQAFFVATIPDPFHSSSMKFAILILALISSIPLLPAQVIEPPLEAKTFRDGDFELNYRIHVPADLKPDEKVPLILILHGAGERGSENLNQLRHGVPALLAYLKKKSIPAIVIVPQCPVGMQWVNVPWGGDAHTMPSTPSQPLQAVRALLAQTLTGLPVDQSRIYISGISMGGFGTWDYLQREPELFAAGIPICGGGDTAEAAKLISTPIWAFHGDQDTTVKTQRSRDMAQAIKQAGGSLIKYTEYPGVGHNSWTQTYANDEALDWLFAQKKP